MGGGDAYVLVTSDCSATTYIPKISWGTNGLVVKIQGVPGADDMPFLESSWYDASWSYNPSGPWCPTPTNLHQNPTTSSRLSYLSSFKRFLQKAIYGSKNMDIEQSQDLEETVDIETSTVCNVNVEVMIDGCSQELDVYAPAIRVIDSNLENADEAEDPDDECLWDYEADIMFQSQPVLEGEKSLRVPTMSGGSSGPDICARATPGRPFVDSAGAKLQASSVLISGSAKEANDWSAIKSRESSGTPSSNSTISQSQLILGGEWTTNALGEHASVASFAAFSIALMTNQAPSDLVEDALKAALDEVRHAKTSFNIASKLTGTDVGPSPLPESKLSFDRDMKALALAVAKEGCVDETLSALEVAAEVDVINTVLAGGVVEGTKYSGVDSDTLVWIRDELRTIALEESSHAALAWRTFKWVCSVDSDACEATKQSVLNDDWLDRAFDNRFGRGERTERLQQMEKDWKEIHSQKDVDAQVCINTIIEGTVGSRYQVA